MHLKTKTINKIIFLILIIIICILFNINYLQILRILKMVIIGFFVAYIYYIILNNLNKKIKNLCLAHIICSIIIILTFLIFVLSFVKFLKTEFGDIIEKIQISWNLIEEKFKLNLSSIIPYVTKYLTSIFKNSSSIFPLIIILPFTIIYSIIYYKDINNIISQTKLYKNNQNIFMKIDKEMKIYIVDMTKIILVLMLMSIIIFSIFKLQSPIFIGIFYAISDLLPIFGPLISGTIISLIVFINSPSKLVGVIIAMIIMQVIEEQVIAPKIHSDSLNFNPLLIIISMLIFGELLGGFGIFFTVPILIIISNIYKGKKEKVNY